MTQIEPYQPDRSLPAKLKRRWIQWRTVQPLPAFGSQALISFTFDDFPRSAAEAGAEALDQISAHGTYYVCSGMIEGDSVMGPLYRHDDLLALRDAGHQLSLHTHSHLDCGKAPLDQIEQEIADNQHQLSDWLELPKAQHFAWPYGETQLNAKRALISQVQSARGILPGINRTGSDVMQLRAMELTPAHASHQRARQAIETVAREGGWLILFTHDVQTDPSPFGVQTDVLKNLTQHAKQSGAHVVSIAEAMQMIGEVEPHEAA